MKLTNVDVVSDDYGLGEVILAITGNIVCGTRRRRNYDADEDDYHIELSGPVSIEFRLRNNRDENSRHRYLEVALIAIFGDSKYPHQVVHISPGLDRMSLTVGVLLPSDSSLPVMQLYTDIPWPDAVRQLDRIATPEDIRKNAEETVARNEEWRQNRREQFSRN